MESYDPSAAHSLTDKYTLSPQDDMDVYKYKKKHIVRMGQRWFKVKTSKKNELNVSEMTVVSDQADQLTFSDGRKLCRSPGQPPKFESENLGPEFSFEIRGRIATLIQSALL